MAILSNGAYRIGPQYAGEGPVTAPPFEAHTFDLAILWDTPRLLRNSRVPPNEP